MYCLFELWFTAVIELPSAIQTIIKSNFISCSFPSFTDRFPASVITRETFLSDQRVDAPPTFDTSQLNKFSSHNFA